MFLLGAKSMNHSFSEEGIGVKTILRADTPHEYVIPVVVEWPNDSEAYVDAESLARQFRICTRGQRLIFAQNIALGKNSSYQSAQKRLELLFHSIERTYTSLPFQCWSVSSEHYVFGMRHILI